MRIPLSVAILSVAISLTGCSAERGEIDETADAAEEIGEVDDITDGDPMAEEMTGDYDSSGTGSESSGSDSMVDEETSKLQRAD